MDCQTLIEKFVNDRDETVVKQLGELLQSKKLTLIDFVIAIGDYLQNIELSKRSLALTLITNVLRLLPNTYLSSNEIHHLLIFTSAKMSDHHILTQPAVDLYSILAKQQAITDDDCIAMIKSIFSDVYVQSLPQSNRYNVFVVLLHFLINRLETVRQLKSDFVCNFIQAMDGERDPRNLVLCFQCLQYITKYLDIEPYKEELFEVVACYFPMEYKPKTTNSNQPEETVTHEQLVLSLRNVLTSTGKFAQYCIPMLIEKLESDIPSARLSAMDVFIHSIEEYDARDMTAYLVTLWNLFSKQALCAENQEMENMALQSITALMKLIGKSIQNDETEISTKKFVDRAIRECENFLKELDLKLVWPATKVLQAVARANPTYASLIWSNVIPLLIKLFENLEQFNHQKTILDMITYFLQPTGIRTVVKLPNEVSEQLWILVATYFKKFSSQCLSLIDYLLQLNCVPGQALEDNLTEYICENNRTNNDKVKLSNVLKILASSALFDRLTMSLLTNLNNMYTNKSTPSDEILEYCIDLCQNSERCQERLERFFTPSEQFISLLPNLFKYLSPSYILTNLFTPLFEILANQIETNQLARIFAAKCGAIADENCKTFVENLIEQINWQPEKKGDLFVIMYFLGNLKRKFYEGHLEKLFDKIKENLIEQIFNSSSDDIFCYFYGNLVNKLSLKNEIFDETQTFLKQCQSSPDKKHIHLWTIIIKSLLLSRPSILEQYLPILVQWMNETNELTDIACQSLKILTHFDEQSLFLSTYADCIIHPMVKQITFINIFSQLKPILVSNDISASQMSVFIDLLNNIPKSIIQDEILSLLPILIRALISTNESIWPSALNSIYDLIKTNPNTIAEHLDTVLPRLSNLAVYQSDMTIRITCLKCLKYLTQLPVHQIQPYRRHIIHVLKSCVDDHKRLVRKEAVETQMSWCLLNA